MKIHSDETGLHIRLTPVEKDLLRALPKGMEPRTGHRRAALRQLVTNECPSPKEAAYGFIGFYDETLDAGHWFSLNDVDAQRAAMLLCRFNPNDTTLEQAQLTTTDATRPRDFVRLLQRFEDLARSDPKPRSLLQWLRTAQELELRYHPWIDDYVNARTVAGSPIVESAPKNRPKLQSVEAGPVAQAEPDLLPASALAAAGAAGRVADAMPVTPAAADFEEVEWATQAADKGLNWKVRVQAQACIIWRQWRRRGGNPTPHGIRGEVRRWCDANDVRTQIQVIPTENTLRVHVLAAKHWTPPRDLTR